MRIDWKWCWWAGSYIRPPHSIFFEASCNIHDKNYSIWWTEADRLKADLGLVKYMCRDIRRLSLWKRTYFYIWAILYYYAVRLFWNKYFNYK